MKTLSGFCAALLFFLPVSSRAQVNSGSNGSDGALNPTANLVIDMADHPDGIYHYTSVNIPAGVTVSFIPNAGNRPVVWLVQGDCVIGGTVDVAGKNAVGATGGNGGPGGWRGGSGVSPNPQPGEGPGGGRGDSLFQGPWYRNGDYSIAGSYGTYANQGSSALSIYGNSFVMPLLGGSGGGGWIYSHYANEVGVGAYGGGGGGGVILIVSSSSINLGGSINSSGGIWGGGSSGPIGGTWGSGGSGGAVRLVTPVLSGTGAVNANGNSNGGSGRIRVDALQSTFSGTLVGSVTQGFQPIILPAAGQGIQLSIASIAGIAVSSNPSGVLVNPDVIIPAQQTNPIPIVVNCNNIPLNSEISVIVHPANGPDVQAVATNNTGTLAASTATVSLNMPRGGGIIYAKCVSGLAGLGADNSSKELRTKSLTQTGWTTDGERFAKVEVTASLGGQQQIAYITESGKRYSLAAR